MSIEDKIKNSELLVNTIGRFPTFHDSEVLQIVLDRSDKEAVMCPNLLAKIHVVQFVSTDDDDGTSLWNYYPIELCFSDIDNVNLQDFNAQNVLFDLHINEIPALELSTPRYEVIFVSTYGVGLEFTCSTIVVESVGTVEHKKN